MGNCKTVVEQFTYASFINEAMTRKKHKNCDDDSSRSGDFSFTKTKSFEEAERFAIEGWDLGLKEYKIEDGLVVSGSTDLNPSLAGCIPHVQNHIMGFPQEMYSLYDDREYNLPTLDIVVNLSYHAGIDSTNTLNFGKSIVNYINTMASNYNIRVTGVFAQDCYSSNLDMFHVITLKDFDSALVINNIAFAFHPSFFRRIWFSIFEGKEYFQSGYGSPIKNIQKIAKEHLTGGKSDKIVQFKNLANINNFIFEPDDLSHVTI